MLLPRKLTFAICVVLFACAARCSPSASSVQHGRFHDLEPGVHIMTADKKLVVPTLTTREQNLNAIEQSSVDWNFELLRDAPHHSIVVQDGDKVYTLHWYETEMGNVTNGDILLESKYLDYLINHAGHAPPQVALFGLADSQTRNRWPCPIPWTSLLGNDARIPAALAHIEEFTPWRFVQRTSQSDYITFVSSSGCSSYIGRVGGQQDINLAGGCETAAVVHEIMHAIGIPHEQSRSDRDNYVQINFGALQSGTSNNFDIHTSGQLIGEYDFGSIMHYGVNDFSATGAQIIIPKVEVPETACFQIGQRIAVSGTDVQSLLYRYDGGGSCPSDLSPYDTFSPCTQAGSMRVCGGKNLYNGVYIPRGQNVNGYESYVRHPWTQSDRFIFFDGSRWCLGQSTSRCSVASSNAASPDQATWSNPYSVSSCDGGAPANPCASNPCQNGGTCNDQGNGGFTCSCPNVWAGTTCTTPDDDCSPNPCQNGGQCLDTESNANDDGNYQCTCINGYEGAECQIAPDPCEGNPCENGGTCSANGATAFTCSCVGEWTGTTCEESTNSCFNEPCQNGGRCVNLEDNNFLCECPNEFRGGRCQVADNDCSPDPCQNGGVCTDTGIQSFECQCPQLFIGDTCEVPLEACSANPCKNGGLCVSNGDLVTCSCPVEWTGPLCETPDDDCAPNPCQNGGSCKDTGFERFQCTCAAGWEGPTCEQSEDDCSPNPCANGGTCIDGDRSFTCECQSGFEGRVCQDNIDDCVGHECVNGRCVDGVNDYQCDCRAGFVGDLCDRVLDGCEPNPCVNGGECIQVNPSDAPQCSCPTGWTGTLCNIDQNDCVPNHCQNGGICEDTGVNSYKCTCAPGWLGFLCDIDNGGQPVVDQNSGPDAANNAGSGGGGGAAAIGGAVAGVLIVLALIAGGVYYTKKRKALAQSSLYADHGHMMAGIPSNPNEDVVELSMSDDRSPSPMSVESPPPHRFNTTVNNNSFRGGPPPQSVPPSSTNGSFRGPPPSQPRSMGAYRPGPAAPVRPPPARLPGGGFARPGPAPPASQHWV